MDQKTLATLEFHKIQERLARHTSFVVSRELALCLEPSADLDQVSRWQSCTAEAVKLLGWRPNLSLSSAEDIQPFIHRASLGGTLRPEELLAILKTQRLARTTADTIIRLKRDLPFLAEIAQRIRPCPKVEREVSQSINDRGEVVDDASPELRRLRQEVRSAHDQLLQRLERLTQDEAVRPLLQEPIVTLREGRYVLPVKTEQRGRLPGVVHDRSSSGLTLFVEPLETLELNNRWRESQLAEAAEVERVLRVLSALVGKYAAELGENLSALSEIDLALAKARYAQEISGANPELCCGGPTECFPLLLNARHPLLAEPVVPITVPLGPKSSVLIITGPNTGGKTVALKTIGLLTLMAQAGLHIPADLGTRIRVYREVYADIGDEQSIEQSLSTFSSHMGNVIRFLREVTNDSLVLLDEIGAGTDPAEGAALARAVLTHLHNAGATAVVTTHYPELKRFAQLTPGVENACVEFDLETLAPTYHLQIGLPGQSNAFAIAERLGLPPAIIDTARQLLTPVELEMEQMLGEIKAQRREAAEATRQAMQALTEAETLRSQLAAELRELETQRQAMLEEMRQQLHDDLETARERIRTLLAEAEMGPRTPPRLRATLGNLDAAATSLPAPPVGYLGPALDLKLSQRVWVEGFRQAGELCSLPDERGEVEVQIGSMRVNVQANTLRPLANIAPSLPISTPIQRRPLPPKELDIHGLRPNEAQPAIERWLNDLYLAGLQQGRVIHGRGTGALRQAVREYLASHPLVSAFHSALPQEGGDGVTVVTLAD